MIKVIKRFLSVVLLCIFIIITLSGFTVMNYTFKDVEENSWYATGVQYVVENSLMIGTAKHYFSPSSDVSRAMIAQILYNMDETKVPLSRELLYDDVDSNSWYSSAIFQVTNRGYMSGYGKGKFGPNDSVTREQLALCLYNFSGEEYIGDYKEVESFNDHSKISNWALKSMSWAVNKGIISGSYNNLNPGGYATRAEVAVMLKKYSESSNINYSAKETYIKRQDNYVEVGYNSDGKAEYGYITIGCPGHGQESYCVHDGQVVYLQLNKGPGTGKVTVYDKFANDRIFKAVIEEYIEVTEEDIEKSKTCSSSLYDYEGNPLLMKVVDELWDDTKSEKENARASYDWVIDNISYSNNRLDETTIGYLPDFTMMLERHEGICGDYAVLLATMLRYKGIHAWKCGGYNHAWTGAELDGEVVLMDATWGDSRLISNRNFWFDFEDGVDDTHKTYYTY